MLFFGKRKSAPLVQSSTEDWRKQWQDLVPPECRNVPVTVDGKTMTAYVQINHFVMMLQDGLLMQQGFFDVCAHFQRAGYHVIWLMRCTRWRMCSVQRERLPSGAGLYCSRMVT